MESPLQKLPLLAFVFFAAPASSQVATTCYRNGAWVDCTSTVPVQPTDQARALREGQNLVPRYVPDTPPDRARELRRRVGALILAHKCDEAETLALRSGEIDLAEQVQGICRK